MKVYVKGQPRIGLLDTGAQVTVLGEQALANWKNWADELLPVDRSIRTADSTVHRILGQLDVSYTYKDITKIVPTLVAPIRSDLILGIDFMKAFGLQMTLDPDNTSVAETLSDQLVYCIGPVESVYFASDNVCTVDKTQVTENQVSKPQVTNCSSDDIEDNSPENESFTEDPDELPKKVNSVTKPHVLSPGEQSKLDRVLKLFKPTPDTGPLNVTNAIIHSIDTGDAKPVVKKQYPISPHKAIPAQKELQRMVERGILRKIEHSPWREPMLAVDKKDGTVRICLDARELNKVTVRNTYPITDVDQILTRLKTTKYLSSIDLSQAFFQIPLHEDSQLKTAFAFEGQLYCYQRMTMGLKNSPATLAVLIDRIFLDLKPRAFSYVDDFIICSESFEEHLELLTIIAKRLDEFNLTISPKKSHFVCRQLEFLGYILNEDGLSANPDKTKAVAEFPKPTTLKELQRFMGAANWYRRFIYNFAEIAAALYELTKTKSKHLEWNDKAEESFNLLRRKLVESPVLNMCDFTLPFRLYCDASLLAGASVLTQAFEGGERAVAYFSTKFNPQQRNYSATERECLAIILSVEKFRAYIEGANFTIVTDHSALKWLMSAKNLKGRLARWAMRLQPFYGDMVIEHRPGRQMEFPDALSRVYDEQYDGDELELVDINPSTTDEWYIEMSKRAHEGGKNKLFKVRDGLLYHKNTRKSRSSYDGERRWMLCVPRESRELVLVEQHDDFSHLGVWKTYERVRNIYFWPNMKQEIEDYIRKCETCRAIKPSNENRKAPGGSYRDPKWIGRQLAIDFIGPLPKSKQGNRHVCVVMDCFSRYIYAKAMRHATAEAVKTFLEAEVFRTNGFPELIISDSGPQFISKTFLEMCDKHKVTAYKTPYYHPQANQVEASNKSIKTSLRSHVEDEKCHPTWENYLLVVIDNLNRTPCTSTGVSPNYLHFGRELTQSGEEHTILNDANPERDYSDDRYGNIMSEARDKQEQRYKQTREKYNTRSKPRNFQLNQEVWIANRKQSKAGDRYTAKLARPKIRAYIHEKLGSNTYILRDSNGKLLGKYHANDIASR